LTLPERILSEEEIALNNKKNIIRTRAMAKIFFKEKQKETNTKKIKSFLQYKVDNNIKVALQQNEEK